jgi:hypothetical protein
MCVCVCVFYIYAMKQVDQDEASEFLALEHTRRPLFGAPPAHDPPAAASGWPAAVADGRALVSPAFGTGSGSGECVAVAVAVVAGCAVGWRSF